MKTAVDYGESEKKRFYSDDRDPTLQDDERSCFERDRGRIIHCNAFRRLQAKTQVFGLGISDFFRTRLTHSLEVAQIAKGIALRTGLADTDLVEAASLAHDIGHPPFGHTGEIELQKLMVDNGGFEANAQNLRVLSQIEIKSAKFQGLNLCRATVDAILKYKTSFKEMAKKNPNYRDEVMQGRLQKFYYDEDRGLVDWACEGHADASFECQIMNWADDIAYSVHDLEDGIKSGMISQRNLRDTILKSRVKEFVGSQYEERHWASIAERIKQALSESATENAISISQEHARKARRKSVTSALIHEFITSTSATVDPGKTPSRYQPRLVPSNEAQARCLILKRIVWEAIISNERVATLERKARSIVQLLFDAFKDPSNVSSTVKMLPSDFRERFERTNKTEKDLVRVATDYIAGMTDAYAVRIYSRLTGPDFSSFFEML